MDDHTNTITVDSTTVAKNPGQLSIEPLRWIRYRPKWPLIWASLFLGSAWLTAMTHWGYGVLAVLFLTMNWFYWKRLKEHFLVGCANPAVIVGISPTLIAVYTDLSCDYDSPKCPTIKIIQTRLPKPQLGNHKIGDKLLTVSLYQGRLDRDRWLSFDPLPACQVSKNQAAIEILKSELSDEWETLEAWLSKVPEPKEKGLYAFDQGNDIPRGETQEPPEKPKFSPKSTSNSQRKSPWSKP